MAMRGDSGMNHVIAGLAAAIVLPAAAFGLKLPFIPALVIAAGVYLGLAFLLSPRRAIERVDAEGVGRVQAELVARLVEDGEATVARLRAAARGLKSKTAARTVGHMADAAQTLLDKLAAEPGKLPAVRRFLTYYLPRSAEIAEGLATVEEQRRPDPARLSEIETMLGKLDQAFTFYADNFAQAELEALDIELRLLGRSLAEDIEPLAQPRAASPEALPRKEAP